MIHNFRWQIMPSLAGMARPRIDAELTDDRDLEFLLDRGFTAMVSLTPDPLPRQVLEEHGLELLHLPIEDYHSPHPDQVAEFVAWVDERIAQGGRVGVHCMMGQGRTGTMLACYLVSHGDSPQEALRRVRERFPSAVETRSQERFVFDWSRELELKQRREEEQGGGEAQTEEPEG